MQHLGKYATFMLTQQICCGIIIVNKYVYTTPPGIRRKDKRNEKNENNGIQTHGGKPGTNALQTHLFHIK